MKLFLIWGLIAILYLATRLINLGIIPIFTDEAIYSHWAQIALHDPGNRFISLEDGKQPLFIWFDAISQKFVDDPLIAGRLVSVVAGFGSLVGIYLLSRHLFNQKTAILSALLYVILPFTLLYDRMALFDSLLTMFGIWSIFLSVKMVEESRLDWAILNGFAIGLGMITKSSAVFFLYLLPVSLTLFNFKIQERVKNLIKWLGLSVVTFVISQALYNTLRLSPLFYIIERKNNEFIRTFPEVFANPFLHFVSNSKSMIIWLADYTSWPLLVIFITGILLGFLRKKLQVVYLSILIAVPFLAEGIFNKVLYPRFMLFYYPYVIILISFGAILILDIFKKYRRYLVILLIIVLTFPTYTSFKLITAPAYANIPESDSNQYFNDWPAGYGVREIVEILRRDSAHGQVHVATEGTFGLMPFALNIYLYSNNNVHISSYWPLDPDSLPQEIFDIAMTQKTYVIFYQTKKEPTNPNLKLVARYQKGKGNSYMRIYEVIL